MLWHILVAVADMIAVAAYLEAVWVCYERWAGVVVVVVVVVVVARVWKLALEDSAQACPSLPFLL
jgi:hypothetical protein